MQRESRLFRSWNTLPRTQNFKTKFEFQTLLAQNSFVGTSELLPSGANLDLPWDWIFPEILLGGSSLTFIVGVYYDSILLGNYMNGEMVKRIFPCWGFTMLLLSWGNTPVQQNCIYASPPYREEVINPFLGRKPLPSRSYNTTSKINHCVNLSNRLSRLIWNNILVIRSAKLVSTTSLSIHANLTATASL